MSNLRGGRRHFYLSSSMAVPFICVYLLTFLAALACGAPFKPPSPRATDLSPTSPSDPIAFGPGETVPFASLDRSYSVYILQTSPVSHSQFEMGSVLRFLGPRTSRSSKRTLTPSLRLPRTTGVCAFFHSICTLSVKR